MDSPPPVRAGESATSLGRLFVADRDVPCPSCGYNLRGSTLDICPECGSPLPLAALRASRERAEQRLFVPYMRALCAAIVTGGCAVTVLGAVGSWRLTALVLPPLLLASFSLYSVLVVPEAFSRLSPGARRLRTALAWSLCAAYIISTGTFAAWSVWRT